MQKLCAEACFQAFLELNEDVLGYGLLEDEKYKCLRTGEVLLEIGCVLYYRIM